jgi:chromosome segregation ATPase
MRKPKVRDQKYYDVLEKHVLELMQHGVTLNKWHALQAKLAVVETKLAAQEAQVSAYLAAGVSWTSEGKWVNTAALRLEADLKRVKEENASLQRAYVRVDDVRAQLENLQVELLQAAKVQGELNVLQSGVERLRVAIEAAEKDHQYACLNHGNSAQCAAWDRLQTLKDAMALVRQG